MKMIFAGLATLAIGAMTAAGAIADGLPRGGSIKDAPPPAAGCAYFGGFFVGGHAAWNDYKTSRNDRDHFLSNATAAGFTEADDAFGGGVGVGYNFQNRGKCTMWGVEGDFSWSGLKTTTLINPNHPAAVGDDFRITSTADWIATLRTRGGIIVDNALLYLTGGLAFTDIRTQFRHNHNGTNDPHSYTFSETQVGMVAGAGLEIALTERISLKSEVLYFNFGDWKRTGTGSVAHFGASPLNQHQFSGNDEVWSSRTGINVRF